MALAIDITDGRGLSNEARLWILSKKSKVMPFISQQQLFNQLYITNKAEPLSFKSGRAVRVAKLTKTDWLVVLQ